MSHTITIKNEADTQIFAESLAAFIAQQDTGFVIFLDGDLGAGKTTLINQILSDPQGKRYLVMVNDFGAINVDASLLVTADEDT
ncbi:MAG: tRNA (adenosine(37)-N6)-threonylcarbamoyltransferase complex ATPase subunit type 1 TsaE, partial [Pseudomonadales bacterium]